MQRTGRSRITLGLVGLAFAVLLSLAAGSAGAAQKANGEAKLTVDVRAQKFVAKGGKVLATGPVVAQVERSDGTTETIRQEVNLRVKPTKSCRILELDLARLYVNLLGLEVRTSEIHVRITGKSKQALGRLFCNLSQGLKLDKAGLAKRTAKSLNKTLDDGGIPVLNLKATVRPQRQGSTSREDPPPPAPGSCEVLDVLLGPLHLNLLGLIVDLYGPTTKDPVRVLVTADPNGGTVGSSLCQFAGPYQG